MPKVTSAAVPVRGCGSGLVAVVAGHELTAFVGAALEAAGARPADAELTAEVLVAADLAGAARHGVVRLLPYVRGLWGGTINGGARPEIVRRYGDVTVIDAHHGLGQPALAFAVDRAVEQARVRVRRRSRCSIHAMSASRPGTWGGRRVVAPSVSSPRVLPGPRGVWGGLGRGR